MRHHTAQNGAGLKQKIDTQVGTMRQYYSHLTVMTVRRKDNQDRCHIRCDRGRA